MDLRVQSFVRAHGKDDLWEYLRANPTVSTVDLAREIGGVIPVELDQLVVKQAQAKRQLGELCRNLIVRKISGLPGGWDNARAFDREMVFFFARSELRKPFTTLLKGIERLLMHESPPPKNWKPVSSEDPTLLSAYQRALAALPQRDQDMVARGEIEPNPGDLSYAIAQPAFDVITWDEDTFGQQFAALSPATANLFAVYACKGEIDNGGLQQFFFNSTGVLAPEAKAGFAAIGMPRAAALIDKAMTMVGTPYPRQRDVRIKKVGEPFSRDGKPRKDPFLGMDDEFYELMKNEAGGFETAADAYAAAVSKKTAK